MKQYEFTVVLTGYGENEQEAWADACEGFNAEPGENPNPGEIVDEEIS